MHVWGQGIKEIMVSSPSLSVSLKLFLRSNLKTITECKIPPNMISNSKLWEVFGVTERKER